MLNNLKNKIKMPKLVELSDEQINSLASLLNTAKGEGITPPKQSEDEEIEEKYRRYLRRL